MLHAGLTPAGLAAAVQVDVKSVLRWIGEDRMPYPVTRVKVAHVLDQAETFLWPALLEEDGSDCLAAAAVGDRAGLADPQHHLQRNLAHPV